MEVVVINKYVEIEPLWQVSLSSNLSACQMEDERVDRYVQMRIKTPALDGD